LIFGSHVNQITLSSHDSQFFIILLTNAVYKK